MNEEQQTIFTEFRARAFGPDVAAMKAAGFGGTLGDEYQRGVANLPPLSAADSVARAAWRAGKDYRNNHAA